MCEVQSVLYQFLVEICFQLAQIDHEAKGENKQVTVSHCIFANTGATIF